MNYFSGFLLQNELSLFGEICANLGKYSVVGFSRGAIDAIAYVLNSDVRIDNLVLISPAYFEDRDEKFKRSQLAIFQKDRQAYTKIFYRNIAAPARADLEPYQREEGIEELERLLYYQYEREQLRKILNRGVQMDVHLGECDRIINSDATANFFEEFATIYYYKKRGHILHG